MKISKALWAQRNIFFELHTATFTAAVGFFDFLFVLILTSFTGLALPHLPWVVAIGVLIMNQIQLFVFLALKLLVKMLLLFHNQL